MNTTVHEVYLQDEPGPGKDIASTTPLKLRVNRSDDGKTFDVHVIRYLVSDRGIDDYQGQTLKADGTWENFEQYGLLGEPALRIERQHG